MLDHHIDATHDAKRLRWKVRVATACAIAATTILSVWAWVAYLPGFLHMWYLHGGDENSASWILFGLSHGLIWITVLPLFFGSLFCSLLMMFILQELAYINILTCFNHLDTR